MEDMKHPLMRTSFSDGDMAIQEVTRAYEIATKLEPLLPLAQLEKPQSEFAGVIFREVLEALARALCILKSGKSGHGSSDLTSGASSISVSDQASDVLYEGKAPTSRCRKREQREGLKRMNPWTEVTNAPHEDGYQWRKYGEKNIGKAKSVRSYYRCSYKDQGCQATKQIEHKGNSDQPLFLVTYYEEHTCQTNPNTALIALDPVIKKPCLLNFDSNITNDKQGCQLNTLNQQKEVVVSSSNCTAVLVETSMTGSVMVEGEHLMKDDMVASACLSPPWEDMVLEYLRKDALGVLGC